MEVRPCCLTCSMFQLLADRYPKGFDPNAGNDIMESLAKVAAFILKNADDVFLDFFAAQVRFERNALRESEGIATPTKNIAESAPTGVVH